MWKHHHSSRCIIPKDNSLPFSTQICSNAARCLQFRSLSQMLKSTLIDINDLRGFSQQSPLLHKFDKGCSCTAKHDNLCTSGIAIKLLTHSLGLFCHYSKAKAHTHTHTHKQKDRRLHTPLLLPPPPLP